MEFYDEWLATGVHQYTEAGNMKPASRELVVIWILEAWRRLDKTLIGKSFKSCRLNLKVDGSEDNLIHCFQNDRPCASGSSILKEQLQLLKDEDLLNHNPFEPTDSDIEGANIKDNLIDMDDTEGDFVIVDNLKLKNKGPFNNYVTPEGLVGMVIFVTNCYEGVGGHSSFVM